MPGGARRRLLGWFSRHPRFQLLALLVPPAGWFGLVYYGSLALLLISAFWTLDPTTHQVLHQFSLANLQKLVTESVYPTIALRTTVIAAIVTVADAVIAFPIAYYMARVASPRTRAALAVAVLLPLWASYLVRVYAWRVILSDSGLVDWAFAQLGVANVGSLFGISDLSMTIVFIYLWLPYMILPIFAGLAARVVPGGVGGPGRAAVDDLSANHPAAGHPGPRGGVDLHLLPDPGRLHHAQPGIQLAVHRQRHRRRTRRGRRHPVRGRLRHGPHRDHGRVPARRPPPGRVRGLVR